MRNKGFTMMELVVVMAIIAILAAMLVPAVNRARKKAAINKAEAEMASLASTGGMIYLDTGAYVPLFYYDDVGFPGSGTAYGWNTTCPAPHTGGYNVRIVFNGTTTPTTPTHANANAAWDGPYSTFQEGATYTTTPPNGSLPIVTGTNWDATNDFPVGTPLDPWNRPYGLAWSDSNAATPGEDVMIVYSAGPDGIFQTDRGATVKGDNPVGGVVENPNCDDLLYKFK